MTDALGNEIVIGEVYGYSNRSNGLLTVIIGKIKKINEKNGNVTIEVAKRGRAGRNYTIRNDFQTEGMFISKKSVSVLCNSLFPLKDVEIKW